MGTIIKPAHSFERRVPRPAGFAAPTPPDRAAPNDYIVLICATVRYYPLLGAIAFTLRRGKAIDDRAILAVVIWGRHSSNRKLDSEAVEHHASVDFLGRF